MKVTGKLGCCKGCSCAKATAAKVNKVTTKKAKKVGEHLFVDASGPHKKSSGGSKHWFLAVDDKSSKAWSFFATKKSSIGKKIGGLINELIGLSHKV